MEKYNRIEIQHICSNICSGGTPKSTVPEYYSGNIPWLNTKEINFNRIYKTEKTITDEGLNNSSAKWIPTNSVIVAMYGATAGKTAIAKIPLTTNQACCNLTIDSTKADYRFVYYALCNDYAHLASLANGGAQQNLNAQQIKEFEIPFPPLEEQKYIADILSSLDDKIELNRRINDNLEAMAKQLYDYWFVQFDFPDENGRPYKSSGGKMVWNEKLKREIPKDWKDGVLSDIANITMGQSPDGSTYNEVGAGIIFYQGSTDFGIRFPSVRQYTTAPSRYANKGDILMSVRAPVGALNIANNDCCVGRGLSALSSKAGSMTHLYYTMNNFRLRFEDMNSVGTTFGSITKDELYSLPVVLPNHDTLLSFEKICAPIYDKQMVIGEEIGSLTKQRDELLPLLMNAQASLNSHLWNSGKNIEYRI